MQAPGTVARSLPRPLVVPLLAGTMAWALVVSAAPPVSADFVDRPVREVLSTLAARADLQLVMDPDIGGDITLHVRDQPWELVLQQVLATSGLAADRQGRVLRVATPERLIREARDSAAWRAERDRGGDVRTIARSFSHAGADDVAALLRGWVDASIEIFTDARTNTVFLRGPESKLQAAGVLVEGLADHRRSSVRTPAAAPLRQPSWSLPGAALDGLRVELRQLDVGLPPTPRGARAGSLPTRPALKHLSLSGPQLDDLSRRWAERLGPPRLFDLASGTSTDLELTPSGALKLRLVAVEDAGESVLAIRLEQENGRRLLGWQRRAGSGLLVEVGQGPERQTYWLRVL
ncbi:MAG: hypothetical protein AAF533_15615 [Acidobacteriota bacterium]